MFPGILLIIKREAISRNVPISIQRGRMGLGSLFKIFRESFDRCESFTVFSAFQCRNEIRRLHHFYFSVAKQIFALKGRAMMGKGIVTKGVEIFLLAFS